MAFTVRKDIMDNMIYQLEQIASLVTVTRWRDTEAEPYDPSECPALNIKDRDASIIHNISDDQHELKLTLEVHTTSRISADYIESLLGDVAAKISANDTWGGHADGSNLEGHEIDINQTGDIITAATLDIIVNYTTAKGGI